MSEETEWSEVENQTEKDEDFGSSPDPGHQPRTFSTVEDLHLLEPGEQIAVHRQSPTWAAGFLDHISVPEDGLVDILEDIRECWGGGRFKLQPKTRAVNGKLLYSRGSIIVSIAGSPKMPGHVYRNGQWVADDRDDRRSQPVVVQQQNPQLDPMQQQIMGLVESLVTRQGSGSGANLDVVGLIGALQGVLGKSDERADPYKDLERSLGLIQTLKSTFGGESQDSDPSDMSDSGIMNLMMSKLMGGNSNPQPPPGWGPPPPQHGAYPPTWAPSAHPQPHAWQGAPPHVPWQGDVPPHPWQGHAPAGFPPAPPHGQGAPLKRSWSQQQSPSEIPDVPAGAPPSDVTHAAHASPEPARDPYSPETAPAPPSTDAGAHEPDPDDGPFTIGHLRAELQAMEPGQREAFLADAMRELGIDEMLGKKLEKKIEPNGRDQNFLEGHFAPPMDGKK